MLRLFPNWISGLPTKQPDSGSRSYRERLHLNWGIVDVDDCINGAKYLVAQGLVDQKRVVIRGSSAGGYTTLAALTFRDFFQGGASHYGVSDAAALARDTQKFESRYLDWLIGPYPQEGQRYRERSPLYHAERLSKPVIFFQGDEDERFHRIRPRSWSKCYGAKGDPGRSGRRQELVPARGMPGSGTLLSFAVTRFHEQPKHDREPGTIQLRDEFAVGVDWRCLNVTADSR
jgi:dienelactone hydrolase